MLNRTPTAQVLDTAWTQPTPWASATRGVSSLALQLPNLWGTAVGEPESESGICTSACLSGPQFPQGHPGQESLPSGAGDWGMHPAQDHTDSSAQRPPGWGAQACAVIVQMGHRATLRAGWPSRSPRPPPLHLFPLVGRAGSGDAEATPPGHAHAQRSLARARYQPPQSTCRRSGPHPSLSLCPPAPWP